MTIGQVPAPHGGFDAPTVRLNDHAPAGEAGAGPGAPPGPQRAQRWQPRDRTRRVVTVVTFTVIVFGGLLTVLDIVAQAVHGGWGMLLAIPVLLVYALVWWLLIRRLDRLRTPGAGAVALAWGACVAPQLSRPCEALVHGGVVAAWGRRAGNAWSAALGAPPIEETSKVIGVLVLAVLLQRGLRGPLHGLLLGATTGLGFAIVEDIGYVAKDHGSMASLIERMLAGLGSHVVWTALTGLALGLVLASRHAGRVAAAVVTVSAALVLHAANDAKPLTIALALQLRPILGTVAATVTVLGVAPLLTVLAGVFAVRWAQRHEAPGQLGR